MNLLHIITDYKSSDTIRAFVTIIGRTMIDRFVEQRNERIINISNTFREAKVFLDPTLYQLLLLLVWPENSNIFEGKYCLDALFRVSDNTNP